MEEQVMQAVGKVAGIGGIALGVFLLLFQEVIRKNIFPTLSDDEAYRLIRQFMYLTFTIALIGVGAWMYITLAAPTAQAALTTTVQTVKTPDLASTISGTWTADVKYNWGDTNHEIFTFMANGQNLSGTATYVSGAQDISDGALNGPQISFKTISYSDVDGKRYKEKHHYMGTVSGDHIDFVLTTDSGYDTPPPLNFTAHKKAG